MVMSEMKKKNVNTTASSHERAKTLYMTLR
jgi:hypothetical protein